MPEACELLPLATGKVPFVREDAVCCYRNSGISAENTQGIYFDPPINAVMIRHGKYKLNIWHSPDPAEKEFQGELYDMEKDPQEMNNLWNDPDCLEVRRQLTERLLNWSCQQELRQRPRSDETLPKVKMKNALK
jgi:arylsulfatase A-like enzyme